MPLPLSSTALVTGAGRGVGRAMAIALATAGARVALIARSRDQLEDTQRTIEAAGGTACALPADVTDADAVLHAVTETERAFGPIDLLVNNAGHAGAIGQLWEIDANEWWKTFEVNVHGAFLFTRTILPGMVMRRNGRIVNVASGVAFTATPYSTSYGASKAALVHFTESVARSVEEFDVRVFALSPGLVHTAMTDQLVSSPVAQRWLPQFKNARADAWISPDHAATLIVRIAAGDADALTGRYLHATADLDALIARADDIIRNDELTARMKK